MIEFIPVELYSETFYNFLLIVVLLVYFQSTQSEIDAPYNIQKKKYAGWAIFLIVIFYMGLRPISGRYFGDMPRYAEKFIEYSNGAPVNATSDYFFEYYVKFCSEILTLPLFFILCAFLYMYPAYLLSKRFFRQYWFYGVLIMLLSLSFWGYGTNGIRNGLATSFFLWGLSYSKKYKTGIFFLLAVLFHGSVILPIIAYLIALSYKNTKMYLYAWLLAIPLSLAMGAFFENIFMSLGFGEDRLQGYLTGLEAGIENSKTGFRWDFLLYSFTGVFAGWYFIIKKKYEDVVYIRIFNVYLICNTFWILVIKANFSNRFAYLSWFLLWIVIVYPFLKLQFFKRQHKVLGIILVLYFFITYLFNVISAP